jgi:hypothetical protein
VQVCVDLRIADHIWQKKCSAIAATIDGLGDKFKPELRVAWLAYFHETYPMGLLLHLTVTSCHDGRQHVGD